MRLSRISVCIAACITASALSGCATREVKDSLSDRAGVKIFLREHREGLFRVIERDFQHPAEISAQRLEHILGAIDIRGREKELAGVRAAFEPQQLSNIAFSLAHALRQAGPNQEIAVNIVRKQMQNFIFNRKLLTSFVAYVQNDLLYLHFSRVDWQLPDLAKKIGLPEPRVNEHPMKFKVDPESKACTPEGNYAVSLEWQDPIFRRPLRQGEPVEDDRRKRTILMEEPEPAR